MILWHKKLKGSSNFIHACLVYNFNWWEHIWIKHIINRFSDWTESEAKQSAKLNNALQLHPQQIICIQKKGRHSNPSLCKWRRSGNSRYGLQGSDIIPSRATSFIFFFNPMPLHVRHKLRGLPPGCGWSVTDFRGWDAHEARLRCPDEVDGHIWIWSTRRDLKLKFY
jgi:hypothetical protein